MAEIKGLDPFNLCCSICKMEVKNDEIYAIVGLPTGEHGVVCCKHIGVDKLVRDPYQLVAGASIKHSAWAFREELSVKEVLEVINAENEELSEVLVEERSHIAKSA